MTQMFSAEKLYEQYRRKVLGYISSRISSWEDAEDLTEEVFVKLFRAMETFEEREARISTLIYKMAHDIVIDYYRTHREHSEIDENSAVVSGADEVVADSEKLTELKTALEQLTEEQREIIILHYYKGITLLKIADMMNVTYRVVKYRHQTALEQLKGIIAL